MALPQVAIVGRPNVGKSSLLNRLARRRVSIVDPTPGVTRDRVSTILEIDAPAETPKGTPARLVEVIDTGGYGVYTAEGKRFDEAGVDLSILTPDIEGQIRLARERAQLVLFVIDAKASITALDETIARLLREEGSAERVMVVANKVDGEEWVPHGLEAAGFGLGEPICVSATSGYGMRNLLEALWERIGEAESEIESEPEMKLAIIGKRNAGKSTLINALAGEERVIVSEVPGTTRDSVDVRFEIEGRTMIAIDTAGVRKRKSFADDIEYYAYHRMLASIRRADVALLLIDASLEVSQVDKKLSQELQRQFKPTVIVVNKWDVVDEAKTAPADYLDYLTEQLRGLDYAPIVFISAEEREGLRDLIAMAFNLHEQAEHRESTGRLNRVVEEILRKRGPSSRLGTQAKLYYASQIDVHPPTIVLKVNQPKLFEGRYERYLLNRLREELPFSEVPIRLLFSQRTRAPLEDVKRRGKSKPPPRESTNEGSRA
ncbi:MAG: ribosome biogenesis GTPase Der [Planctomycetota bacterium]|nr:ribosome biogenesis GTPase Der [Planctomycetota bacterium]